MTNGLMILLYAPFVTITGLLTAFHILSGKRSRNRLRDLAFFLSVLLWQILDLSFFFLNDPMALEMLFNAKTALTTMLHTVFFTLILYYYSFVRKISKPIQIALYGVPLIVLAIALSSPFHGLMTKDFTLLADVALNDVDYVAGILIYIELAYSTAILLLPLVLLCVHYRRMPKIYKSTILVHIISCVLLLFGVWFHLLAPEITINISVLVASVCALFHYMTAVGTNRESFMQIERSDIMDLLDQSILILNQTGMIISVNASANNWFKQVGQELINVSLKELLIDLEVNGKILRKPVMDGEGEDIYVLKGSAPTVYRMERHALTYYDGMLKGTYITFTDVTRNRILIEQLRDLAGIDALTGLPNRFRYQEILRTMDTEKNYPLSIIMGDVNGLKTVNDSCGHERGDQLLVDVAAVLSKYCPKNGYVARYGGDEFVILIPICAHSRAQAYIQTVQSKLCEITGYPVVPGIALGSATKNEPHENINALIAGADELMYKNKRRK